MVMNPPSGTRIHPRDWMEIQRLDARLRCIELAQRHDPTAGTRSVLARAETYFEWAVKRKDE